MPTCPLCLTTSPDDAKACVGCGRFRFPSPSSADSAPPHRVAVEVGSVALRTLRGTLTVPTSVDAVGAGDSTPAPATVRAGELADAIPSSTLDILATPRLVVIRGQRIGNEFPIYEGRNYAGRSADRPVDIDLNGQEDPEQVWVSRQHAVFTLSNGSVVLEDLNSLNGTFVNRTRVHPGHPRPLQPDDVVQIGTVQFRFVM